MRAKREVNAEGGMAAYWEFCLMFALFNRGYNERRVKQGMKALSAELTRFDAYSKEKAYKDNDTRKREDAVFIYEIECATKGVDWEAVRALEPLPDPQTAEYAYKRDKGIWNMIAAYALSRTYNMKTETIIGILRDQQNEMRKITTTLYMSNQPTEILRKASDVLRACVGKANKQGIDWAEILGVEIQIGKERLATTNQPKGCAPFAVPVAVDGINLTNCTNVRTFKDRTGWYKRELKGS